MIGIQTDSKGSVDQIEIDLAFNREAEAAGARHAMEHLDNVVRVDEGMPTPRQQVYHQLGLNRKDIKLKDAMDGKFLAADGDRPTVNNGQITGRLAVQNYLMDAIEDSLRADDGGIMGLFNRKAAVVDSIPASKFDRPIISYKEQERARAIAQLSEPTSMLTLTASDTTYKIPGESIGIEYSDQAAEAFTLPIVTMAMRRQAEEAAVARVEDFLWSFYNGDADIGMDSLASAGRVVNLSSYDSHTQAQFNQSDWMQWLFADSRKRRIDTIITTIKGALAVEHRLDRPTVMGDDPSSTRINTIERIANAGWPDTVEIMIVDNSSGWSDDLLVGFDSRYGYHHVVSTSLAYNAVEEFAIRRSTKIRIDTGSIAYRLYDEAWSVLNLAG